MSAPWYPERQGYYDLVLQRVDTRMSAWVPVCTFLFLGSDRIGAPKQMRLVCGQVTSGVSFSVRVMDLYSAKVVAEVSGIDEGWPVVKDLGEISNVPEEEAVWEVQFRKDSGLSLVLISAASLHMRF